MLEFKICGLLDDASCCRLFKLIEEYCNHQKMPMLLGVEDFGKKTRPYLVTALIKDKSST